MISLATLSAEMNRRGLVMPSAAARLIGRDLAELLSEAHAAVDEEGDLAPIVLGRLSASEVLIDTAGDISIAEHLGQPPSPEPAGRLTPRADLLLLGHLLVGLLPEPEDELGGALATAVEPVEAKRRITAVELEALLARGLDVLDVEAARCALGDLVRAAEAPELVGIAERPLSPALRVAVALATATIVYGAGLAIVDRWAP